MAKFCKFCGTPLEEGQVCNCAGAQAAAQPNAAPAAPVAAPAAPAAPSKAKGLFEELKNIALAALKAPATGSAQLAASANKLPLAGILAGINAIAIFLLLWRLLAGLIGSLTGLAGAFGAQIEVSYPIFPMLLAGIVVAAAFIVLYGVGLFLFAKLGKVQIAIMDALVIAAGYSVMPSALLLIATLLGFLSPVLGLIFMIVAIWTWMISMNQAAREYTGVIAIRSLKELALTIVIRLVIVLLVYWLSSAVISWSITELAIEGTKLSDIGSLLGSLGDLGDLFS